MKYTYLVKWGLAAIGMLFLGWTGCIIGFIIGGLIELITRDGEKPQSAQSSSRSRAYHYQEPTNSGQSKSSASSSTTGESMQQYSILVLIAKVMAADGHITKAELNHIKPFLVKKYGEYGALIALQKLRDILQKNFDVNFHASILSQMPYNARIEIVNILLGVAFADGDNQVEVNVAHDISAKLGVSESDYRQLLNFFTKTSGSDWAYNILGITASATNDEVKRAFRQMAMKFHPDKVAGTSPEIEQSANERFRKINEAYEFIKKQRNIP